MINVYIYVNLIIMPSGKTSVASWDEPEVETVGGLACTVYFVRTADSGVCSLTRLPTPVTRPVVPTTPLSALLTPLSATESQQQTKAHAREQKSGASSSSRAAGAGSVILVAGSYSNRNFYISRRGHGLGPHLRDVGFDVWLLEPRGHGRARGRSATTNGPEAMARYDVPAAAAVVAAEGKLSTTTTTTNTSTTTAGAAATGEDAAAFWLGHSAGGCLITMALSLKWLPQSAVRGAVIMGTEMTHGYGWYRTFLGSRLARWVTWLAGGMPADKLGWGPEAETFAYVDEFIRYLVDGWKSIEGEDVHTGLAKVRVPLLAVAARGDTVNPPEGCEPLLARFGSPDKEYKLFSRDNGNASDFSHVGMVVSKQAAIEIWPYVGAWMASRV